MPSACAGTCGEAITLQLLLAVIDILLMMRVYALYNRSLRIACFLALLFIATQSTMAWAMATALPKIRSNSFCILTSSPPTVAYFGGSSILEQSVLFGMTACKFAQAARAGWGSTALIALLMRDGTWAFALVFGIVMLNSTLFVVLKNGLAAIAYPWLFTICSFATCRLVLNTHALRDPPAHPLRRVVREDGTGWTDTRMEFTTRFATEHELDGASSYAGAEGGRLFAREEDPKAEGSQEERYEMSPTGTMSGKTAWSAATGV